MVTRVGYAPATRDSSGCIDAATSTTDAGLSTGRRDDRSARRRLSRAVVSSPATEIAEDHEEFGT
jgi:hypothetical protein